MRDAGSGVRGCCYPELLNSQPARCDSAGNWWTRGQPCASSQSATGYVCFSGGPLRWEWLNRMPGFRHTIGDGPNSSRLLFRRKKLQCLALDHDVVRTVAGSDIESATDTAPAFIVVPRGRSASGPPIRLAARCAATRLRIALPSVGSRRPGGRAAGHHLRQSVSSKSVGVIVDELPSSPHTCTTAPSSPSPPAPPQRHHEPAGLLRSLGIFRHAGPRRRGASARESPASRRSGRAGFRVR